jgi:hypothetical protein
LLWPLSFVLCPIDSYASPRSGLPLKKFGRLLCEVRDIGLFGRLMLQ